MGRRPQSEGEEEPDEEGATPSSDIDSDARSSSAASDSSVSDEDSEPESHNQADNLEDSLRVNLSVEESEDQDLIALNELDEMEDLHLELSLYDDEYHLPPNFSAEEEMEEDSLHLFLDEDSMME